MQRAGAELPRDFETASGPSARSGDAGSMPETIPRDAIASEPRRLDEDVIRTLPGLAP